MAKTMRGLTDEAATRDLFNIQRYIDMLPKRETRKKGRGAKWGSAYQEKRSWHSPRRASRVIYGSAKPRGEPMYTDQMYTVGSASTVRRAKPHSRDGGVNTQKK